MNKALWKIIATTLITLIMIGVLSLVTSCTKPPTANLAANKIVINTGDTVHFSDNSSGKVVTWLWNFGDGTSSSEQNPTYVFTKNGDFVVTLTASNKGGNSTDKINVRVLETTVAGLTYSKDKALVGESIQFANKSTGDIASYYWDFGDGTTSTEKNASHTYSSSGNFTVSLKVANELNNNSKSVQVKVIRPVKADFSVSLTKAKALDTIQFTDNSTGDITFYSWYFGDLTANVTERNPSHIYTRAGDFPVSLEVSNELSRDIKTIQVQVLNKVRASFSASSTKARAGDRIQFTGTPIGKVEAWSWDFGDGDTSTEQNPTHVYKADGTYTVTLTVNNPVSSDTIVSKNYITIASLNIKLVMCSSITTIGIYTPKPDVTFNKNEPIFLYLEINGFQQKAVSGGFDVWVIVQSLRIYLPDPRTLINVTDLSEAHRTSTSRAESIYWAIPLNSYTSIFGLTGEYKVEVVALDKLSGNMGIESTNFIIK